MLNINFIAYNNMQATPITELNLTDYACQELLVSFAVTNEAGLSNFSDPAQVSVHGGIATIIMIHYTCIII